MMKKNFPEENEVVLCIVNRVLGTTVFVKILGYEKEGVVATSEVAPGRIRNIRDYVIPGKRIVCKVLRIDEATGHIDLSLRRISQKEKETALEKERREKDSFAILKIIKKNEAEKIAEKIKERYNSLLEFLQKINEIDKKELVSLSLSEEERKELLRMGKEKSKRVVSVRKDIKVSSEAPDGVSRIKSVFEGILKKNKNIGIKCLSSPRYSITVLAQDYKEANKKLEEILEEIKKLCKENNCNVDIK